MGTNAALQYDEAIRLSDEYLHPICLNAQTIIPVTPLSQRRFYYANVMNMSLFLFEEPC